MYDPVLEKPKIEAAEAEQPAGVPEDPLLAGLNPEQLRAVTHEKGPLLIVAGAGTGKTTVVTKRIAWLITSGRAKSDEVLALTFTEKAAGEMTERIETLLPLGYVDLWVSTFHAFCQRLLSEHGLDIGLPNDFRLLTQTDAYLLVRQNFDRFKLDYYRPLGNPTKFIHALLSHFSRAKDEAISPDEYLEYVKNLSLDQANPEFDATDVSRQVEIANAYHEYQRLLAENGAMDFGDLLLHTIHLLKKRPAILKKYQQQFKHILVDEFQDTNWAQYELIKMLAPASSSGNIIVVGDDDQSIYKFRGASISNILQFKNDYPTAGSVVLTSNYRSKQNILDVSYKFIQQNNPNRLEARLAGEGGGLLSKKLVSSREGAAAVKHLHFETLNDEATGVVDKIVELKGEGGDRPWSDFCILVRSNGGAEEFSAELYRRGIPYQFLALSGLYSKPIILDCIAYFKLLDDYHESPSLYRILCSPPYHITGADLVALTHESRKKAASLYETIKQHSLLTDLVSETRATLDRLLGDIEKHTQIARGKSISEVLIRFIYDSGYAARFAKEETSEAREQVRLVKQFLERLKRFEAGCDEPSLRHFMEEFALERDSGDDGALRFDIETGPDMVRIMTVHAAKGLEFPHVFIVGMVDKRFPTVSRGGEIELPDSLAKEILPEGDIHLEEERRLFYVAMTRARDGLFLSSAEDYGGKTKKKLSRFLTELGFSKPEIAPSVRELERQAAANQPSTATVYEPPPYFSFTQLAAYSKCPLQYKFAHVLKIPVFGKPQFSFGKTIHATLEKFLDELTRRNAVSQVSLFDAGGAPTGGLSVSRDELMKMYEESWEDDWYPDKPTKEKYRDRGRQILELFYENAVAEPPSPLFLEKDFKIKIGQFWIKGTVDRIDAKTGAATTIAAEAPEVAIIDYKTGTPKEADDLTADDKQQLFLYQIAVSRLFGLKPTTLTFHYLEDGSKVSFIGSEKEIAKFEIKSEETITRIVSGDYAATPGMHCKFCDFAGICEYRK